MASPLIQYTIIVLLIYTIVMLYLGYRGYKTMEGQDDMETFTLARGYLGPVSLGIAYAATWSSAIVFIGIPGWGYVAGMSVLWHTFLFYGGAMLAILLMAKRFRRLGDSFGALSLPEWIGNRYNNQYLTAIFGLLVFFNVLYVAAQFTGLALLFEGFLNISYLVGALGALVLVIIYVSFGGTYTDVMTDYIQGILMAIVGVSVFASIFWLFGGIGGLTAELSAQSPQLLDVFNPNFPIFAGPLQIVAIFTFGLILGIQPHLANKFLSLENEKDIRTFIVAATVAFFFFYFMIWGGPIARALNPELATPDKAIIVVITNAFPAIVAAIFGAGLISAALSTTDGLIVSIGTAIGNDVYRNLKLNDNEPLDEQRRAEIEHRSVRLTRATVLVAGIIAAAITTTRPQFIATLASIGIFGFVSAATPPMVLGIFWDRGTAWGAFASAVVGPIGLAGYLQGWWLTGFKSIYVGGIIVTIISAVAMVVVSQFTRQPEREAKRSQAPLRSDD